MILECFKLCSTHNAHSFHTCEQEHAILIFDDETFRINENSADSSFILFDGTKYVTIDSKILNMSPSTSRTCHDYEIEKCSIWIRTNNFKKVCLQFPEYLLKDASEVVLLIEQKCIDINPQLFIIGDTSHRSCCVDIYAARHVNADAIIHFDRACLSPFHQLPVLFIFPKEQICIDSLVGYVQSFLENNSSKFIVLLYDIAFAHCINDVRLKLFSLRHRTFVSYLTTSKEDVCEAEKIDNDPDYQIVRKLGRWYKIPLNKDSNIVFIYIVSKNDKKNFENFVISSPEHEFYSYDVVYNSLQIESIPKTIRKRLFDIEKTKQAKRIGILVATLEVELYLDVVERIRKLCRLKGKKSYIVSVGKPNVAKLANFPEIDLFVMISCPEAELSNKKDYFQPVVTVMEIELALNDNHSWMNKVIADFREFLPEGNEYKPINENQNITNDTNTASFCDEISILQLNHTLNNLSTVALHDVRNGLESRSWKGLQMEVGDNTVHEVTIGRRGTPSSGYTYVNSQNAT